MATVEILLSDLLAPCVQLFLPSSADCGLEEDISRVLQRSLSLPITMRSLLRRCNKPDLMLKQARPCHHYFCIQYRGSGSRTFAWI
jgi:hypothetical protein